MKAAKKAPAKPKEKKVKEVIVRWDILNPKNKSLFGLHPDSGKNKKSAVNETKGNVFFTEVVRVTIERFEK